MEASFRILRYVIGTFGYRRNKVLSPGTPAVELVDHTYDGRHAVCKTVTVHDVFYTSVDRNAKHCTFLCGPVRQMRL